MANLNVDSLSFEARSQVNLFFNRKSQKPNSSMSDFGGCPVSVFLVWLDYHKCSNTITITLNFIKNDIQTKSYPPGFCYTHNVAYPVWNNAYILLPGPYLCLSHNWSGCFKNVWFQDVCDSVRYIKIFDEGRSHNLARRRRVTIHNIMSCVMSLHWILILSFFISS